MALTPLPAAPTPPESMGSNIEISIPPDQFEVVEQVLDLLKKALGAAKAQAKAKDTIAEVQTNGADLAGKLGGLENFGAELDAASGGGPGMMG